MVWYANDSVCVGNRGDTAGAPWQRSCNHAVSDLAELRERADKAGKRLPTFSLETAVRFSSPSEQAAFMEGLSNAVAGLVHRYHDETKEDGRWLRVTVGAHPALEVGGTETPTHTHSTLEQEQ